MNSSEIDYRTDRMISSAEFRTILERSGLAERRPVEDLDRLQRMLSAYTFIATAWDRKQLIGVSTVWTDYAFTAYLADLAVDSDYQKRGIGQRLVEISRDKAGLQTTLLLLAAPKAASYYPKIGMERFLDCFLIRRSQ